MPTFDLYNIVRRVIAGAVSLLCNPMTYIVVISGTITALASIYLNGLAESSFYQLSGLFSDLVFDWSRANSSLVHLCAYCLDLSTLQTIWDWFLRFFCYFVPAMVEFVAGCFALSWGYRIFSAVFTSLRTMTS